MTERIACDRCYQKDRCEERGNPLATSAVVEGGEKRPYMAVNCFFHCCQTGVLQALDVMDSALADEHTGLLPFESLHKPFVDEGVIKGRFIAVHAEGYAHGDVVVFHDDMAKVTTNIFNFIPPAIGKGADA